MKYLLALLLLTGCTTVPVSIPFPEANSELLEPCQELSMAKSQELSEFTKTVVDNYEKYHLCSNKTSLWQTWYSQQKALYKELK
jgi:hypothetical protein